MKHIASFLKSSNLKSLRLKLAALYALNITDALLTLYLLSTSLFSEANPFLAPVIQNPFAALILKAVLPAVLLIWLNARLKAAVHTQLKHANIIISIALLFYAAVNALHVFFITSYLIAR